MKMVLLLTFCFLMTPVLANAQDGKGDFHIKRNNGYELTVSFKISGGKITIVNYDEWTPVNKSAHECGIEAKVNDGQSTWQISGDTTVIKSNDDENSTLTFKLRSDGILLSSGCNNLKILFTASGGKFVGRILR